MFFIHIENFWVFEVYFIIYSLRYFPIIDVILNWSAIVSLWKEIAKNRISEDVPLDTPLNEELNMKKKNGALFWILRRLLSFINSILAKIIVTITMLLYAGTHYDFNNILWKQLFNGLPLVIIVVLSQYLLVIFFKRMKIAWLEELEKEIILNNYNEEQIIKKLRYGYYNLSDVDNYL